MKLITLFSAGSVIVASSVCAQPAALTFAEPKVGRVLWQTVDGSAGGPLWNRILSMAEGEAGDLFVVDADARNVRQLDRRGRIVRTFGRSGSGPGEFRSPRAAFVRADTLFVDDPQNARLTAFQIRTGSVLTHRRFRDLNFLLALSPRGSFTLRGDAPRPGGGARVEHLHVGASAQQRLLLARYAAPPRQQLSFRLFRSDERGRPSSSPLGVANMPHPLVDRPLFAHTPDGDAVWLAIPDVPATNVFGRRNGRVSRVSVTRVRHTGDTVLARSFDVARRELSSAELTSLVDSLANPTFRLSGARPVANRQHVADSLGPSRRWPAVSSAIAGSDGVLWLQQPPSQGAGTRYWRVAASGMVLAPIEFPRGFVLFGASAGGAWGTLESASGELTVARVGLP